MASAAYLGISLRDRINLCALCMLWAVVVASTHAGLPAIGHAGATAAVLVVASFSVTVINMAGWLPLQNVVGAAAFMGGLTWVFETILQWAGPLAGHRVPPANQGNGISWLIPLLWVVAIINARGVARLILRPAKGRNGYGLWVIGLSAALAALWMSIADVAMTTAASPWIWQATVSIPGFNQLPVLVPLRNLFISGVTLTLGMPWLLNKKPVVEPVNWQPLGMWLAGISGMVALTLAGGHLAAATAGGILCVVPAFFAVMGGTRKGASTGISVPS